MVLLEKSRTLVSHGMLGDCYCFIGETVPIGQYNQLLQINFDTDPKCIFGFSLCS